MAMPTAAAQMYTCREFCKTPDQIVESIRKVAQIGYTAIQASGMAGQAEMGPAELRRVCDGEGIAICATHIPWDSIVNDFDRVVEEHKIMGCAYPGIGGAPAGTYDSEQSCIDFARTASDVAARLKEQGLSFIYHNHSTEFARPEGSRRTILDIFFDESDPAVFNFELDTYWVQHGGGSPVAWINKCAGRCPVLHYKDFAVTLKREAFYTEIGEGNLDWEGINAAAEAAGALYAAVEQDTTPGDPFDSLRISYNNMVKMGLK